MPLDLPATARSISHAGNEPRGRSNANCEFRCANRLPLFFAYILAALVLQSSAAWGHAFLDHASPAVGSTVRSSPSEVRVWFTQRLEPTFTTLQVLDAAGKSVGTSKGVVSDNDPTLLVVPVRALVPGTYRVVWRALSVDGHASVGDFTFAVAHRGTSDQAAGR